MIEAHPSRWRFVAVLIAPVTLLATSVAREYGVFAVLWPEWRGMIEDLALVMAAAVLIAGIGFGITTWRRERGNHA